MSYSLEICNSKSNDVFLTHNVAVSVFIFKVFYG
jgi:hypothetical protein